LIGWKQALWLAEHARLMYLGINQEENWQ
jgi:hypothetical protein